jgi:hypothetical protein
LGVVCNGTYPHVGDGMGIWGVLEGAWRVLVLGLGGMFSLPISAFVCSPCIDAFGHTASVDIVIYCDYNYILPGVYIWNILNLCFAGVRHQQHHLNSISMSSVNVIRHKQMFYL